MSDLISRVAKTAGSVSPDVRARTIEEYVKRNVSEAIIDMKPLEFPNFSGDEEQKKQFLSTITKMRILNMVEAMLDNTDQDNQTALAEVMRQIILLLAGRLIPIIDKKRHEVQQNLINKILGNVQPQPEQIDDSTTVADMWNRVYQTMLTVMHFLFPSRGKPSYPTFKAENGPIVNEVMGDGVYERIEELSNDARSLRARIPEGFAYDKTVIPNLQSIFQRLRWDVEYLKDAYAGTHKPYWWGLDKGVASGDKGSLDRCCKRARFLMLQYIMPPPLDGRKRARDDESNTADQNACILPIDREVLVPFTEFGLQFVIPRSPVDELRPSDAEKLAFSQSIAEVNAGVKDPVLSVDFNQNVSYLTRSMLLLTSSTLSPDDPATIWIKLRIRQLDRQLFPDGIEIPQANVKKTNDQTKKDLLQVIAYRAMSISFSIDELKNLFLDLVQDKTEIRAFALKPNIFIKDVWPEIKAFERRAFWDENFVKTLINMIPGRLTEGEDADWKGVKNRYETLPLPAISGILC